MNLQDAVNLARFMQIRQVLQRMGPERVDKGLTAFEDGASSWSECFFARAYDGELDLVKAGNPSRILANELGFATMVPVRIVWRTFDGAGALAGMDKAGMRKLVEGFMEEQMKPELSKEINSLLSSLTDELTAAETPAEEGWYLIKEKELASRAKLAYEQRSEE